MMRLTYTIRPGLVVEAEGERQNDVWDDLASFVELFTDTACGMCGHKEIIPVSRTGKKGGKKFRIREFQCANPKCRATLGLGECDDEGKHLFPSRKLLPSGKADRDKGTHGAHRGWTTYRGDVDKVDNDKVSTDKVSTDKVSTDKVSTDKVSTDKQGPNGQAAATNVKPSSPSTTASATTAAPKPGKTITPVQCQRLKELLAERGIKWAAFQTAHKISRLGEIKAVDFDAIVEAVSSENPINGR